MENKNNTSDVSKTTKLGFFGWLDLQYRNLFKLPSKKGERRLFRNIWTGKLEWTKGSSRFDTDEKSGTVVVNADVQVSTSVDFIKVNVDNISNSPDVSVSNITLKNEDIMPSLFPIEGIDKGLIPSKPIRKKSKKIVKKVVKTKTSKKAIIKPTKKVLKNKKFRVLKAKKKFSKKKR